MTPTKQEEKNQKFTHKTYSVCDKWHCFCFHREMLTSIRNNLCVDIFTSYAVMVDSNAFYCFYSFTFVCYFLINTGEKRSEKRIKMWCKQITNTDNKLDV